MNSIAVREKVTCVDYYQSCGESSKDRWATLEIEPIIPYVWHDIK